MPPRVWPLGQTLRGQLLFDIKTRTLGFAFCQPPKKSLPKSLTQKKSLQNFKPKKVLRSQISNPKKDFAHPRHLYTRVPPWALPPPTMSLKTNSYHSWVKCTKPAKFNIVFFFWGGGGGGEMEAILFLLR